MNTRQAIEKEEDLVTAFHEAGHVTATIFSEYFELKDPAVRKNPEDKFKAITEFKKIRETSVEPHATASVREFVLNAFAGKAAEELLSKLSESSGQKIYPDPNGVSHDIALIYNTLNSQGMREEENELWLKSRNLIFNNHEIVKEVAVIIMSSGNSDISLQEIYDLNSVKNKI